MYLATAAVYDRYSPSSVHGGARTLNESELQVLMVDMGIIVSQYETGDAKANSTTRRASLFGGRQLITHLCGTVNATMGRKPGSEMDPQAFTAFVIRVSKKLHLKATGTIEKAVCKFIKEDLIQKARQLYVEPLRAEVCLFVSVSVCESTVTLSLKRACAKAF